MSENWIATAVGKMHVHKITGIELANEMDVTPQYVSIILNEHRTPKGAEEKVFAAIDRIVERRKEEG